MATGVCAGAGAASPSPACGAGGWAGVTPWFDGVSARASLGAIRAFSTFVLPHKGQVARPRLGCLSYAVEFVNQLSNSCRLLHTSVYRIIFRSLKQHEGVPALRSVR